MMIRRILANIIDLIVYITSAALGIYGAAQLNRYFDETFTLLILSQVCIIIVIPVLLQAPFWMIGSTIGKTFTFQVVVHEDGEKVDFFLMLVRDFLLKIVSCYFVIFPMLFGQKGVHEVVTNTKTIIKPKIRRQIK